MRAGRKLEKVLHLNCRVRPIPIRSSYLHHKIFRKVLVYQLDGNPATKEDLYEDEGHVWQEGEVR